MIVSLLSHFILFNFEIIIQYFNHQNLNLMKFQKKHAILLLSFLFTLNILVAQETPIPTKERSELVEVEGTITKIDKETREITIMGSNGELDTITAGEEVERFDEIEVGDVIKLEYIKFLRAEFRSPTPEEVEEPLVVLAEAEKAGMDTEPGAAVGAVVKAVVTIQVINLPFMYAVVEGPNGNLTTIDVKDEELLKQLHVGQIVILTYGEAVAVSLDKKTE
jgi:hypothetical protein